jgi:hypothetical protein
VNDSQPQSHLCAASCLYLHTPIKCLANQRLGKAGALTALSRATCRTADFGERTRACGDLLADRTIGNTFANTYIHMRTVMLMRTIVNNVLAS